MSEKKPVLDIHSNPLAPDSTRPYKIFVTLELAFTHCEDLHKILQFNIQGSLLLNITPALLSLAEKNTFSFLVHIFTSVFPFRSYQNDLYVSIPDRLLISSALALILNNIPYEYLVVGDGGALWTSYAKVVAELVGVGPMVTLALFWSIYTGDKLARNEPWERNTKVGFSQEKVKLPFY